MRPSFRRALAVEKERAIKQNELATQIELARRAEEPHPPARNAANQRLEVETQVAAEKRRTEAEVERQAMVAAGYLPSAAFGRRPTRPLSA